MKSICVLTCSVVLALAPIARAEGAPDGKTLYSSKCAMCHGQDGVPKKMGEGSKAFGDPAFKSAATADSIVTVTHDGKGKMKPVKGLSDADAKAIAAYVLTIGAAK
jgi:mono/diheme cytochrome c family protein